jgi:hypothetical protein
MVNWEGEEEGPIRQSYRGPADATGNGRVDSSLFDRPIPSHNLRLQPTPLIGREQELQAARQQLLSDEIRLLTLTGPAGIGKTRLALALAEAVRPLFPHGVWLIELASLQDPAQVSATIAQVLGLGGPATALKPRCSRPTWRTASSC